MSDEEHAAPAGLELSPSASDEQLLMDGDLCAQLRAVDTELDELESHEGDASSGSPTNESCGGGSGAEDNGERAATVSPSDAGVETIDESAQASKIPKLAATESSITPPKMRSLPSPGGSTLATGRLGMAARVAPQAPLDRRVRRATLGAETVSRLRINVPSGSGAAAGATQAESAAKPAKLSVTESRRAAALAMRARIAAAAEEKKRLQPVPASSPAATPRKVGRRKPPATISEEELAVRRSSFSSQSSCSSIASSIASSTASAVSAANSTSTTGTTSSRLQPRPKASAPTSSFSNIADRYSTMSTTSSTTSSSHRGHAGLSASSTAAMKKLLAPGTPTEFTLDDASMENLKSQHIITEKGVHELLKAAASTASSSSASTTTASAKARLEETKLLRGGLKQLNQHSGMLMAACDAWEKRSQRQDQELEQSRMEIQRLLSVLADVKESALFSDDAADAEGEAAEDDDDSPPQTDAEPNEEPGNGEPAKPRVKADSPLTKYVNEMMKKATDQIEEKWKARFAEQLAEHEQALALERERSSASVMSNSRLVTETKHEREDELKALRDENVKLGMERKQREIEADAAKRELDFIKSLLDEQDEERSSSTFWQKTTDLAKANRTLTEEVTQLNQTVHKLHEAIKLTKAKMKGLKAENVERVGRSKELELATQILEDRCAALEAKFEDEKTRREQFQVNVEQLTVENTALYAQMVALQTTHEAKMEELRARYEKRNIVLAGEMRLLQTQNKLMRNSEFVHSAAAGGVGGGGGSSSVGGGSSVAYDEDDGELSERLKEMTEELLNCRQELSEKVDQIAELEWRVGESELVRRKLHNTIQELRGNIRVHVRLRPFLRSDGDEASCDAPQPSIRADAFSSTVLTNTEKPHRFSFDKIYGQSETQESVFNMQGSGKAQMRGIIPRSIQLIIRCCQELSSQGWSYSLDVTFFEIYNETIRDLLATDSTDERKFNIRTDKRGKNYVEGLRQLSIDFAFAEEQVEEIVNLAACNRSVDKTDMNAHSSRSHSIFALTIRGLNEAQNTENVSQCELGAPARQIKSRAAAATPPPGAPATPGSTPSSSAAPGPASAPGARNSPARIPIARTRAPMSTTPVVKKLFQ
ncbi:hypothetical protein PybrP1_005869 [[Pythium] brassicae (nom. inval.)]|nr:hypothetical protein PybrP1_005869 [[Pythium] brassicae (nom. inval.)]